MLLRKDWAFLTKYQIPRPCKNKEILKNLSTQSIEIRKIILGHIKYKLDLEWQWKSGEHVSMDSWTGVADIISEKEKLLTYTRDVWWPIFPYVMKRAAYRKSRVSSADYCIRMCLSEHVCATIRMSVCAYMCRENSVYSCSYI